MFKQVFLWASCNVSEDYKRHLPKEVINFSYFNSCCSAADIPPQECNRALRKVLSRSLVRRSFEGQWKTRSVCLTGRKEVNIMGVRQSICCFRFVKYLEWSAPGSGICWRQWWLEAVSFLASLGLRLAGLTPCHSSKYRTCIPANEISKVNWCNFYSDICCPDSITGREAHYEGNSDDNGNKELNHDPVRQ